jgi:peroxiredoxin
MSVTDRFYGANTMGTGRPIQDFGLGDLKGQYQYTAKLRAKGLLVVVFFSPDSPPSVRALQMVQSWTADLPTQKWTALGVGDGDRAEMGQWAEQQGLEGVSIVIDHELYQTRAWGVSHLPSLYLVSGKTGRVLHKILGEDAAALDGMKQMLTDEVTKIVTAEAAAQKAEEEKKAAEAAAKAAEAAKPSDTTPPPAPAKA